VRQALAAMAAGYSTAAVTMGHLALKRAIRHAEANDLVARNVAALGRYPEGPGRQAVQIPRPGPGRRNHHRRPDPAGDGTAARPEGCPPADRADARLHRAEPAGRDPHEEARALRWAHVNLDGDRAASHPVPPHVAVCRSVRTHGDTKTERSRRTLGLPAAAVQALRAWSASQADERFAAGDDWQDTGLVFTTHHGAALDAANVRKMFKRVCTEAGFGDGWTPRELRTSFVSLNSHHGVSIGEIARLAGHASTRTTEIVYRRELRPVITIGAEIMDELFKQS
jgi:integrase